MKYSRLDTLKWAMGILVVIGGAILTGAFNSNEKQDYLIVGVIGILVSLVAICLTVYSFNQAFKNSSVSDDIKNDQSQSVAAPPPDPTKTTNDNIQCTIEFYGKRGYSELNVFELPNGPKLYRIHKIIGDDNFTFRAEGVLIYPDGEPIEFGVGIIYGEGAWAKLSPEKIHRRFGKRSVSLETVFDESELSDLATKSDYIIPLGLSSHETNSTHEDNLKLAYARAHNLGLAVKNLKWQAAERIWPHTLGYARDSAKNETESLKQRPVFIIGATARREVVVADLIPNAIAIAPQRKIVIDNYLFPNHQPYESKKITEKSVYLKSEDFSLTSDDEEYSSRILPKIEKSHSESSYCD